MLDRLDIRRVKQYIDVKTLLRVAFTLLLIISLGTILSGYLNYDKPTFDTADGPDRQLYDGQDATGLTVVSTSPRPTAEARLLAFNNDGDVVFRTDQYDRYFDVDPVPGTKATIFYVAQHQLNKSECPDEAYREATTRRHCRLNVIETVNLSTGDRTRLFAQLSPGWWHDVDRIGDDRLLIADNGFDRVVLVNHGTNVVEWGWDAQSAISVHEGGEYPVDWTHMNDVNMLDDGRVMVSLRNNDRVVFIDREDGFQSNWTLGEEDNHDILYEQHNPDYIPASHGGPAVVVADSEKHAVVEFQRRGEAWEQTWIWSDSDLQWPRDADRLPNGHTLITDSNGNRVLEVTQNGSVVWSVDVDTPYEAERFGTGVESNDGQSTERLNLPSRGEAATVTDEEKDPSQQTRTWWSLKNRLPGPVLNTMTFVLPPWAGPRQIVAIAMVVGISLLWLLIELYWSPLSLRYG